MKYSDIFTKQWDTLLTDFQINLKKRRAAGLEPAKMDEWYQLHITKWESSIETEGVILRQQENSNLEKEIINQMKSFRFEKVEASENNKPKIKGILLLLAGIGLGIVEYMVLPISMSLRILIAVIVIALMLVDALKVIQKGLENDTDIVRKAYLNQLKKQGEYLSLICKKYE